MTLTTHARAPRLAVGALMAIAACHHHAAPAGLEETNDPTILEKQPVLGALVTAAKAPPPISGGTLAASKTSQIAVLSDPDRDRIYVVDLAALSVTHTVQLAAGVEPGRVALDENGFAYVVLRNSNQLVTVNLASGAVDYRATCIAPRGVAYDAWEERVLVTCAVGDLMSFPPTGASNGYWARVGEDLRDVVVDEGGLHLTGFRKAQVFSLDRNGNSGAPIGLDASVVAWRARTIDTGLTFGTRELVVAQDTFAKPVPTGLGGYGDTDPATENPVCSDRVGIVSTRIWMVQADCDDDGLTCRDSIRLPSAVLPVDIATNGHEIIVVAAGNALSPTLPQIYNVQVDDVLGAGIVDCIDNQTGNVPGQAVAADFSSADELLVQTREPARLHIMTTDRQRVFKSVVLATDSVADTGHEIFHANSGGGLACASCHAEGGDDSHVWTFDGLGPRRTPSLRGTIEGTAPYHWDGDQRDMTDIVDHVFVERMTGPMLDNDQITALQNYVFAIPPPQQLRTPDDSSARGKALFGERCSSCHSGAKMTDSANIDVGTGARFQVPSLVGVAWRGPWIHDGCAQTLQDRFELSCGGIRHADLTGISPAQVADIIAYLETL